MSDQPQTPRPIVESVLRSVCAADVERLTPLSGGGMNESYRAVLHQHPPVVVRIARQPVPWFIDEAELMTRAAGAGVPIAEVLGLEQHRHNGQLLSFSVQRFVPGRSMDDVLPGLPPTDRERLVVDGGELLARVHSVAASRGLRHVPEAPDAAALARAVRIVAEQFGPDAAAIVRRGADFLADQVINLPTPSDALAHGDFMPKNLLVDRGAIVGVIDWEFAGPASPAFDLARWEVSAGPLVHDRTDLLRRGYARVADPERAAAGLVPVFAVDWALEKLGWQNPAGPPYLRRCVEVIDRYAPG
ncbi:phosphotransferase enzyme family protein [Microlunatus soli]|uniref:phosphotransferase enzyme family protein n=1 Tax=Microlunatus soli TaxID=630515 RepID=UPI001E4D38D0|nr:phosphotransferase [Microlunatus soli]